MPTRNVLVLGATGGTGREVVVQALTAGLGVAVIVRDPARLPAVSRPVTVINGDILRDPSTLDQAMRGQDAVICALGTGRSFEPHGLMAQAVPSLIGAMQRAGVSRLVFTSAFGLGATWSDTPLLPRLFIRTLLRKIYADKSIGEASIRASSLDYTIVQPVGLTDGPRTDHVRVGEHLALSGVPTVSRVDVAAVILRVLDDADTIRKTLLIASRGGPHPHG